MPANAQDPLRATDDAAIALALRLLAEARTAALGVIDPDHGGPHVSRIAFAHLADGVCLTLISDLSHHARALAADPRAGLLLGEPGAKGDPLTHPRLSLRVRARPLGDAAMQARYRAHWLERHPKSKLYVDFADFRFVRFDIVGGLLNAGFGKAYALSEKNLRVD